MEDFERRVGDDTAYSRVLRLLFVAIVEILAILEIVALVVALGQPRTEGDNLGMMQGQKSLPSLPTTFPHTAPRTWCLEVRRVSYVVCVVEQANNRIRRKQTHHHRLGRTCKLPIGSLNSARSSNFARCCDASYRRRLETGYPVSISPLSYVTM